MRKNKIHNRIKNKTSVRLNNKDRTIEKWICITMALFFCLLIYKREWYLLLGTIFITIMFIWQQWRLYQECKKELSIISYTLEDILQGKTIFTEQEISDTLLSKIMAQLQRMNKINSGCQEILREEQDNIKRLLAEISHQIRTPLANMEAYLTLAEDKSITKEEYQCYLKAIKNSEEKIKFLTEKLILAARMENKIIQIHKTEMDLKETVANAVFQVYKKAEEKQIFIEIKDKTAGKNIVNHDKNWICEAVYNLLDNSIKYSPPKSKIWIWLQNNEMFTEICVEDEGVGISPSEENKIFQLYYRGNNLSGQEGYGMGLFITREIVKKHDGFVKTRRKEQGLKISIFLPK